MPCEKFLGFTPGMTEPRVPPPEVVRQAAQMPGGWVFEVDGVYEPEDTIPVEHIRGRWRVLPDGTLSGEFQPNPRYQPE